MSSPIVTMMAFSGGLFSTGRITTRSISPPSSSPPSSAAAKPAQYDPVRLITSKARYVVNMAMPPWA